MIRAAAAADSTPSPKMRCGQNILNKIYNKNSYFLLLLLPLSPSPSFFLFALIIILSFFFLPDHQGTKEISKLNSFIVWNCNIASTSIPKEEEEEDPSGFLRRRRSPLSPLSLPSLPLSLLPLSLPDR